MTGTRREMRQSNPVYPYSSLWHRWMRGECAQFALALRAVYGGEIWAACVTWPKQGNRFEGGLCCHAVLKTDGRFVDFEGVHAEGEVRSRYVREEPDWPRSQPEWTAVNFDQLSDLVRDGCDLTDLQDAIVFIIENRSRFDG